MRCFNRDFAKRGARSPDRELRYFIAGAVFAYFVAALTLRALS